MEIECTLEFIDILKGNLKDQLTYVVIIAWIYFVILQYLM